MQLTFWWDQKGFFDRGKDLGVGEVVLCSQDIHRGVTASLSCLALVLALGPWSSKRTIKAKLAGQYEEANGHTADRIQLILWFLGEQTKAINPVEWKSVLSSVLAPAPPRSPSQN